MKRGGWSKVGQGTTVKLVDGEPVEVRSTRQDLDAAFDDAQAWFGAPLDCGEWTKASATEWSLKVEVSR